MDRLWWSSLLFNREKWSHFLSIVYYENLVTLGSAKIDTLYEAHGYENPTKCPNRYSKNNLFVVEYQSILSDNCP